jgi:hypothetical protein
MGDPGVLGFIRHPGVLGFIRHPGVFGFIRHPGVLGFIRHPGVLEAGVQCFSRLMDAGQVHPRFAFIPAHEPEASRDSSRGRAPA